MPIPCASPGVRSQRVPLPPLDAPRLRDATPGGARRPTRHGSQLRWNVGGRGVPDRASQMGRPFRQLRFNPPAVSMRSMFHLSRTWRRSVAITVSVLLLACQGVGVLHAHALGNPEAGVAQESCHDSGSPDKAPSGGDDCQVNCHSQHTSSFQPLTNVWHVTDLPAMEVCFDRVAIVAGSSPSADPPWSATESKSLPIFHCRLRN